MQAMWKHRRAIIENGPSGRFGRYCLTYLTLFYVLLPLIAPVVDVFSVYGLVFLNPVKVTLFWLTFVLLQALAGGTRCGSTGNGCARCGCCRCSRSSTGS